MIVETYPHNQFPKELFLGQIDRCASAGQVWNALRGNGIIPFDTMRGEKLRDWLEYSIPAGNC